jgi:hypothetical protein
LSKIFFASLSALLLAHAYVAVRVGPRLSGKALLFVIAIQIGAALGIVANIAPSNSSQHTLIKLIVILSVEDIIRTWFITTSVKNGNSLTLASLSFAIAISFVEILDEILSFIWVAAYLTPEMDNGGDLEFYDLFFLTASGPLITILIDITRPIDHFLLCIAMYYAWRMRNLFIYFSLVISHIALDFAVTTIWNKDPLNSYLLILGVSLLFTALFCLATLWIRATAKRSLAVNAAQIGPASES